MTRWRLTSLEPKQSKQLIAAESANGRALIKWCDHAGPPFNTIFHIANEGTASYIRGAQMKAEGIRPGAPDYCLPYPSQGWYGLFIELKALNGKPTQKQLEWCELLILNGYMARVVYGWPAAVHMLVDYVSPKTLNISLPEKDQCQMKKIRKKNKR